MSQLTDEQMLQYSRHLLLNAMTEEKQLAILNASVLVVGAGGLGCAAIPYLASAGVGRLILVDGDTVELSNLHRQILHTHGNLDQAKVASARDSAEQINPKCQVETHARYYSEDDAHLLEDVQVVLDCSDNLDTRNLLNRLCFEAKVPLVSGSAIRFEGQLITLDMKPDSACYACFSHMISGEQLSCSQSGVFSPVVGVIGSLQATEALKIIAEVGEPCSNRLCLFDGMDMSFRSFNIVKGQECEVCGC